MVGGAAGLLGSAVGGAISFLSSRITHSEDAKRDVRSRSYEEREKIYSEFMGEAVRVVLLSLHASESVKPEELVKLVTLEARIWFHSESVGTAARLVAKEAMRRANSAGEEVKPDDPPDKLFAELRDSYTKACTTELRALRDEV